MINLLTPYAAFCAIVRGEETQLGYAAELQVEIFISADWLNLQ